MKTLICGKIRQNVQDRFSILLPAADVVRLFGDKLKLSRITTVPQENLRPRLILNLSAQPDDRTPSVNDTTDREVAPEPIKF